MARFAADLAPDGILVRLVVGITATLCVSVGGPAVAAVGVAGVSAVTVVVAGVFPFAWRPAVAGIATTSSSTA